MKPLLGTAGRCRRRASSAFVGDALTTYVDVCDQSITNYVCKSVAKISAKHVLTRSRVLPALKMSGCVSTTLARSPAKKYFTQAKSMAFSIFTAVVWWQILCVPAGTSEPYAKTIKTLISSATRSCVCFARCVSVSAFRVLGVCACGSYTRS